MAEEAEPQKQVYQFKIALKGIKPAIWRRIQVPEDYSFLELSYAIINAMGWLGGHLHGFEMKERITGERVLIGENTDEEYSSIPRMDDDIHLDETITKIKDKFIDNKSKAQFTYDYGDGWEHEVRFQKKLPAVPGKKYPFCVAGKRACPPEDCGGVYGYKEAIEILNKPKEQRTKEEKHDLKYKFMLSDINELEKFDKNDINFDNRPSNDMFGLFL